MVIAGVALIAAFLAWFLFKLGKQILIDMHVPHITTFPQRG